MTVVKVPFRDGGWWCPKCGRIVEKIEYWSSVDELHLTCACGHSWDEQPLDVAPPSPAPPSEVGNLEQTEMVCYRAGYRMAQRRDADTLRKLWRVAEAAREACNAPRLEEIDAMNNLEVAINALDDLHDKTPAKNWETMSYEAGYRAGCEQAAADRALADAVRAMPKDKALFHSEEGWWRGGESVFYRTPEEAMKVDLQPPPAQGDDALANAKEPQFIHESDADDARLIALGRAVEAMPEGSALERLPGLPHGWPRPWMFRSPGAKRRWEATVEAAFGLDAETEKGEA